MEQKYEHLKSELKFKAEAITKDLLELNQKYRHGELRYGQNMAS